MKYLIKIEVVEDEAPQQRKLRRVQIVVPFSAFPLFALLDLHCHTAKPSMSLLAERLAQWQLTKATGRTSSMLVIFACQKDGALHVADETRPWRQPASRAS